MLHHIFFVSINDFLSDQQQRHEQHQQNHQEFQQHHQELQQNQQHQTLPEPIFERSDTVAPTNGNAKEVLGTTSSSTKQSTSPSKSITTGGIGRRPHLVSRGAEFLPHNSTRTPQSGSSKHNNSQQQQRNR